MEPAANEYRCLLLLFLLHSVGSAKKSSPSISLSSFSFDPCGYLEGGGERATSLRVNDRDSLYSGGVAFLPIAPPPFVCCWQISFLGRCCSSRALLFSPPESLGSQRGQSSSSSSSFWRFSPPPSSVSAWGICLQPSSPFSPEKSGACFHFQIPSCSSPSPPAVSGERGEKKFGSFNLNLNIL